MLLLALLPRLNRSFVRYYYGHALGAVGRKAAHKRSTRLGDAGVAGNVALHLLTLILCLAPVALLLPVVGTVLFKVVGWLNAVLSFLLGVRPFPVGSFSFAHCGVATLDFTERKGVYFPALRLAPLIADR